MRSRRWRSGCPSLLDGLVLGWPLDDPSGTRRALMGNPAGVLTDVNTVTTADAPPGIGGLCANFDGSTEYLSCPDPFAPPAALSVFAWAYPTTVAAGARNIIGQGRTSGQCMFQLWINGATVTVRISNDGSTSTVSATAGTVSANAWALVGFTWDGATLTAYNGTTPGTPQAFALSLFDSSTDMSIGAILSAATNYFSGRIAQPLIWRRALSPAQIAYLNADGSGRPLRDWMPPWWLA